MKLIFINSCEDISSLNDCFVGRTDVPLTDNGMFQTIMLGEYFSRNVKVTKIISSPLERAVYTARFLQSYFPNVQLGIDENIIEMDGGLWEDLPFSEILGKYSDIFINLYKNTQLYAPDGEAMENVYSRAEKFVSGIKHEENAVVVVIAHQIILKNILCRLIKNDISKLAEIEKLKSGSITEFLIDNDEIILNKFNWIEHLGND